MTKLLCTKHTEHLDGVASVYLRKPTRGDYYRPGNPAVQTEGHGEGERRKAGCFGQGRSLESEAVWLIFWGAGVIQVSEGLIPEKPLLYPG